MPIRLLKLKSLNSLTILPFGKKSYTPPFVLEPGSSEKREAKSVKSAPFFNSLTKLSPLEFRTAISLASLTSLAWRRMCLTFAAVSGTMVRLRTFARITDSPFWYGPTTVPTLTSKKVDSVMSVSTSANLIVRIGLSVPFSLAKSAASSADVQPLAKIFSSALIDSTSPSDAPTGIFTIVRSLPSV